MSDKTDSKTAKKSSFFGSLSRAQVASLIATATDNAAYVLLNEKLMVWYLTAAITGAALGALVHFTISRFWVFKAKERTIPRQAWRYILVSSGSLLLNAGGVWMFTELFGIYKHISKGLTAVLVGLFYNFVLHRYFVFNK